MPPGGHWVAGCTSECGDHHCTAPPRRPAGPARRRRPGFDLVGVMAYEAQIAGIGDAPAHRPLYGAAVRALQARSARELARRRADAVAAIAEVTEIEFVNGGGTGSVERTAPTAS